VTREEIDTIVRVLGEAIAEVAAELGREVSGAISTHGSAA
jgi:hypothetical protein